MKSDLIQFSPSPREGFWQEWHLRLYDHEAIAMDKEQLELIQDGLWLILQGLGGNVHGPLATPLLKIPVRNA